MTLDKFQTRDELVKFIDDTAGTAVDKALKSTGRVERRVPWATSGPVGQDSVGYSMLKAAAYALGFIGADQAKEELHTHHQLRDLYGAYGFAPQYGAQSFLVPLSSSHLPVFEPQGQKLKVELEQKMTAQAGRFDPDEAGWLARRTGARFKALGSAEQDEGGSLVPNAMLGEVIDLQRRLEAFSVAGASEIALPPSGRLQWPKFADSSVAFWVGEGSAITESQPGTGVLSLQAKKLGVLVKLNNELIRFASASAEGMVRYDMARAAALKADAAMFEGSGSLQIQGLLSATGLATHTASTVGANGNTFQPQDVALMESKLPDSVEAPTAWILRKSLFAALMNRRADAIEATDGRGDFLFRGQRSLASPRATELQGIPVVRSSQVSATRSKGTASNLTFILLGYFPDWIIARLGVMEFLASGHGDSAIQNDQTFLRGIQHIDAGPRHAASFVLCDQLIQG